MARKTFISYKFSDSVPIRDAIIRRLAEIEGLDYPRFYMGEDGLSDDLSSLKAETIRQKLYDMIYGTSVLILILSKNIDKSGWVEDEVRFATRITNRGGVRSQPNGVVVVVPDNLVDANNRFYVGHKLMGIIEERDVKCVKIRLTDFLRNTSYYIESVAPRSTINTNNFYRGPY